MYDDPAGGNHEPEQAGDNTEFLRALQSSIKIFVNRMTSDHSRGRSIANDSAVQGLFMTISQMHPQLLKCIHEQEQLRSEWPKSTFEYLYDERWHNWSRMFCHAFWYLVATVCLGLHLLYL